jgi:IS30 family transposase
MGQQRWHRYCTAAESAEIWDRWKRDLTSIGRVFRKSSGSIFCHLMPFGGIRPRPRRRSRLALILMEREEISRGLINGDSLRMIATSLCRAPSTVSREAARNGGLCQYRAAVDQTSQAAARELYRSLTWDRGMEMTDHKRFTLATDVSVYFCDPQSPWQRGSNENTNRLLRQYFPKRTDLAVHSQARLNQITRELNERPRKTLNYESPAERFQACVASIS